MVGHERSVGHAEQRRRRDVSRLGCTFSKVISLCAQSHYLCAEIRARPAEQLRKLVSLLKTVTLYQLRYSLAQRMLKQGAKLSEVQPIMRHSRLSTTGIYLTPHEDDITGSSSSIPVCGAVGQSHTPRSCSSVNSLARPSIHFQIPHLSSRSRPGN